MQMDKGSFRDMKKPTDIPGAYDWYMEMIDPYMGHQYVDSTNRKVYFRDGSSIDHFFAAAESCLDLYYDVNGDKAPNRVGYDTYVFLMCFRDADRTYWFGNKDVFFGTYGGDISATGTTRAQMLAKCGAAATAYWCSRLLQNDQWEFKSDYPYKF